MWYVMSGIQQSYDLSDRLIRAISNWQTPTNRADDVESVLAEGADVNQPHGTLLPLHTASMVGDVYCMSLLLERGAELNTLDGYGRAALHYAAERNVECVELLLSQGADANQQGTNFETALHWAAQKNHALCARKLLQHGANVDMRNYNGDTPLSWAARKGSLEAMKVLLEYDAEVDTYNVDGNSPLMRAAGLQAAGLNTEADDACLELLLAASGQVDLRNSAGELPLLLARDNKLSEMFTPLCSNAESLQKLCRYALRVHLSPCYLPQTVAKLPLPSRIRRYVLLQTL